MIDYDDCDDDGYYTCEYCGERCPVEVGMPSHRCPEGKKVYKKSIKEFNKNFKGKGRVKGKLTIEYECFDSDMAFTNLMDNISLWTNYKDGEGEDNVMECKWKVKHIRDKIN